MTANSAKKNMQTNLRYIFYVRNVKSQISEDCRTLEFLKLWVQTFPLLNEVIILFRSPRYGQNDTLGAYKMAASVGQRNSSECAARYRRCQFSVFQYFENLPSGNSECAQECQAEDELYDEFHTEEVSPGFTEPTGESDIYFGGDGDPAIGGDVIVVDSISLDTIGGEEKNASE